jgi:hypothetical protein
MQEQKPPRSLTVGSWLAAVVLAAPASYLALRLAMGVPIGGATCIPGAIVAGLVWGAVLWPSWRLGRRGLLLLVALPGALHALACVGAVTLGWGRNAQWGPAWTLGALFEFYAVLVFLLFAALVGVWRLAGDKRVSRALWLRPLVVASAILAGAACGGALAFGLLGLSENTLKRIMSANEAYLKEKGEWAPELVVLAPRHIAEVPAPPWYLADSQRVQYGHLPKSTHYWLNWGAWQACQSVDPDSRSVTTEEFRYAPREYGGDRAPRR